MTVAECSEDRNCFIESHEEALRRNAHCERILGKHFILLQREILYCSPRFYMNFREAHADLRNPGRMRGSF